MSSRACRFLPVAAVLSALLAPGGAPAQEKRYLYVVAPGIRNYLEFGGAGILVFDIDHGHRFVKRIETTASRVKKPLNIKGVCACPATRRLYFTTPKQLCCVDLVTEKTLWHKELPQGCDRMAMTPDGKFALTAGRDRASKLHVWELTTGRLVAPRIQLPTNVVSISCPPDASRIVICSLGDGSMTEGEVSEALQFEVLQAPLPDL